MDTTTETPPRARRRVRLTLGVMMALVLALGGGMGWIAYRARVQREAVAAILKSPRAYIRYQWQPKGNRNANAKPPGPKWLRDALGADVFDTVVEVIFPEPLVDQAVLRDVGRLDRLEWLAIVGSGKSLSPESIASIGSLHRLKSLRISGVPNREALFPYLSGMPDLVSVDLDFAQPTDAHMAHLSELLKLERINLDGRSITDLGFANLSKLKALKYLRMPDVKITTLEPLRGMSNLEELTLTRGRHEDGLGLTSLAPLRGKTKLKTLMLGWNPITDDGMEGIETLTSLTLFQSDSAYLTAKSMDQLRKAPNLVSIVMRGEGLNGSAIDRLADAPTLSGLMLRDAPIGDLRAVRRTLGRLRNFALTNCYLQGDSLGALGDLASLQFVGLTACSIGDSEMTNLPPMPSLERLVLDRNPLTDAGLSRIAGLPRLKHLSLNRTAVTDNGMASLVQFPNLSSLNLAETGITDAAIPHLAKLQACQSLEIFGTKITPEGERALKRALPGIRISRRKPMDSP